MNFENIGEIIHIIATLTFAGVALWGIREMNIMLNPKRYDKK